MGLAVNTIRVEMAEFCHADAVDGGHLFIAVSWSTDLIGRNPNESTQLI